MSNILEALNLVGSTADAEQKKPKKKTTLDPDYVNKNKQDLTKTFQTNPENDYNAKIRSYFGLGQ